MRRWLSLVFLLGSLASPFLAGPTPAGATDCQFVLGFKSIHDLIPQVVGNCTEDEHHNAVNGDALQATTGVNGAGGLLVWRKLDNWTAYTDGYRTWINGPFGLESRLNVRRFVWEQDATTQNQIPESAAEQAACASVDLTGPSAIALGCRDVATTQIRESLPVFTTQPAAVAYAGQRGGLALVTVRGAAPGRLAGVGVITTPGGTCLISYVGPDGTTGAGPDLGPQVATTGGQAIWVWPIPANSPRGTGRVQVSCLGHSVTTQVPIG